MQSNYYIVKAVCGHVGKGKAIDKDFAVYAHSGKEAAAIARLLPRVKHDFKYAIKSVMNVDQVSYSVQMYLNDNDPYLHCTNRSEQAMLCPTLPTYNMVDDMEEKRGGGRISRRKYVNCYCFHDDYNEEY